MLAVEVEAGVPDDSDSRLAGVTVEVGSGEILSCVGGVAADPDTWAVGISTAWLDLVLEGRTEELRIGGAGQELARELAEGIHRALFTDR